MNTSPVKENLPELPVWRCFHCDEVFTDIEAARLHFGDSEYQSPICTIDAAHFRWMEAQHRRNVDDDSEALRTIRGLVGEHETLRRRAEELGYARGLADAQKHPADLGLQAIAAPREGWQMVPKEPTEAMLQAGHSQIDYDRTGQNTHEIEHESHTATYDTSGEFVGHVGTTCKTDVQDAYRAMLVAAPKESK